MTAVSAQYNVTCPTCGAPPSTPCRVRVTGRVTDTHVARLAAYRPRRAARRALDAEQDVLDDHQRLHVDCTSLTETWTMRATREAASATEAAIWSQCARELTELLRSHA